MNKILKKILVFSLLFALFLSQSGMVRAQIRNWDDIDGDGIPNEAFADLNGNGIRDPGEPPDSCLVGGVPTLKCLEVVIGNILFMSNALILLILFIMLIIGGYRYLLSMGEAEKMKQAQGTLKWAVIGIVLYAGSYLILNIVDVLFLGGKGELFKFRIGI
ncbi:hypothetical protein KC726_03230 [Candidatus Woesebacteria bacterium]|nr:hypothetical protein [Candidatus Woesebacteria bacterium]